MEQIVITEAAILIFFCLPPFGPFPFILKAFLTKEQEVVFAIQLNTQLLLFGLYITLQRNRREFHPKPFIPSGSRTQCN